MEELAKLIEKSVKNEVEGKEVAVAFSGGIDSTTLAFVAKKYAKKVVLYSVGFPGSKDLLYSLEIAKELNLEFKMYLLDKEEAKRLYEEVEKQFSLGFLKSEILAPVKKVFEVAKENEVLFGSGSEELFVGYDRYYVWRNEGRGEEEINKMLKEEYRKLFDKGDIYYIKELAKIHGKEAVFPFCSKEIEEFAFSTPLDLRMKDKKKKKHILRESARILGVPEISINRAKKALQYGTGIHKELLKLKKRGKL